MTQPRVLFAALLAVALGASVAPSASAADREVVLRSRLSGDQVVQQTGGDPDGTGTATLLVDAKDGLICFDVETTNVDQPISGRIQSGSAGAIGPPLVFLFDNQESPVRDCVSADRKTLREIARRPGEFYLNVVNEEFPIGAVRGQLENASP